MVKAGKWIARHRVLHMTYWEPAAGSSVVVYLGENKN